VIEIARFKSHRARESHCAALSLQPAGDILDVITFPLVAINGTKGKKFTAQIHQISLVPVVSHLRSSLMGLAPSADDWKISTFARSRCRQNPFLCPADNSDLVFFKWCVFDYAFFIQWSIGFLFIGFVRNGEIKTERDVLMETTFRKRPKIGHLSGPIETFQCIKSNRGFDDKIWKVFIYLHLDFLGN
jgi:hypothetical protein